MPDQSVLLLEEKVPKADEVIRRTRRYGDKETGEGGTRKGDGEKLSKVT